MLELNNLLLRFIIKNMKITYNLIYVILSIILMYFTTKYIATEHSEIIFLTEDTLHSNRTETLSLTFGEYHKKADILFQTLVGNEKVINIMTNAFVNINNHEELQNIRNELFNYINPYFENLKTQGFIERINFHLPNATSFLRMHKKDSYGDDLSKFRKTVIEVQKNKKIIRAIETGLRSVYPIINQNNQLVGSVEICVSFKQIRENVEKSLDGHVYFIFRDKVFGSAKVENAFLSKNFYHFKDEINIINNNEHLTIKNCFLNITDQLSKDNIFQDDLEQNQSFYKLMHYLDDKYFLSFFPLKDLEKNNLGYMVFFKQEDVFNIRESIYYERITFAISLIFISMLIILFLINKLNIAVKQENKLKIKNSTFEKLEEISNLAIIIYNLNTKTVSMNSQAREIFGITEKVIDEPINDFKWIIKKFARGNFRALKEFVSIINNSQESRKFNCLVNKNNEQITIEGKSKLDIDGDEKILYIIFSDITKEKQYQLEIENLLKVIDNNVIVSKTDLNGLINFASHKFVTISGFSKHELIGSKHNIVRSKDTDISFYENLWQTIFHGREFQGVVKNIAKDGTEFWLKKSVSPDYKNGEIIGFTDISYDITTQVKFEELSRAVKTIFDAQSSMIVMIKKREVTMANRKFLEFVGYENVIEFNKNVSSIAKLFINGNDLLSPSEDLDTKDCIHKLIADNHDRDVIVKMRNNFKNIDEVFNIDVSFIHDNYSISYVISFTNITGLFQDKVHYKYQATHDILTDSYNKSYFNDMLQHHISNFHRYDEHFSVIIFDIDHFKKVNDTYGHLVGDTTLITLSAIVKSLIRESDIFARWGGEEFVVLTTHTRLTQSMQLAEKLRTTVEESDFPVVKNISISCGVTEVMKNDSVSTLIKRCDDALYRAKRGGRNRVEAN